MEPFKNWINIKVIQAVGHHFSQNSPSWHLFDIEGFRIEASHKLESLELKARTAQLTAAMKSYLPAEYLTAARVIEQSLGPPLGDAISGGEVDAAGIKGWALMALAGYVGLYGQHELDVSMDLLQAITRRGSSEFAVRLFLLQQPVATLDILQNWVSHEDHHVRRLVSEGTRPRLPWGCRLKSFIQDPAPTIRLLEMLKHDESEYVRRSVANHLNDISKDNPELVVKIAQAWFDASDKNMTRLLRHACRTLLKSDHQGILTLFGYSCPDLDNVQLEIDAESVIIGGVMTIVLSFQSNCDQDLMIDYVMYHQKSNGTLSPKVFKWKKVKIVAHQALVLEKKHSFKKVTTRVYHPGQHIISIKINGQVFIEKEFILKSASSR